MKSTPTTPPARRAWRSSTSTAPIRGGGQSASTTRRSTCLFPQRSSNWEQLMTDLEADPSVKVVVFQSANPDFFIAHLDVAKAAERPEVLGLWREFVLRLSSTPVVSIAKIRGRTRGIGNEFVLACDMRFASRQSALFGNPEVGVGLVPGGGALEWLPRLVGRSRALEIVLSGDDFDADIAERYGWVNRTLDDYDLDPFVDNLVRRLASFDHETLAAAKDQINRFGTPTANTLHAR